ncbi:6-bladed beta-propeller [Fodinibius halophilus]|uniref:6-bladed beta-propeller n=1 Tax=Fodinibius halophilus TaxID=1736908 RepID=A0A6M1T181_9BACT|nr:BF3164 family lipoprotein [Fodinibius halophilus]NGP87737.1 6-bladed beta-propeller [Fodinibius halophilus]
MNFRISTALLLTAIFVTLSLTSCNEKEDGSKGTEITKNEKGEILTPEQRKWKKGAIGEEISLHDEVRDSLLRGMSIEVFGNQLYVSDFGDMRLKKFTRDGKYIGSYGKEGRGPGEFQQLMDFDQRGDSIYVLDSRKMELMFFDKKSSSFITSHKVKSHPYRFATLGNRFVIERSMEEKLFSSTDLQGNIQHQFGQFIESQTQNGLSVSGNIETISDTGFVFSPSYASYLYYFNKEGEQTKVVRTVDRIPFQKPVKEKSGNMNITKPPTVKVYSRALSTEDNLLLILQRFAKESDALPTSFIDVYHLDTGQYRYSIELPLSVRDVELTRDRLYMLDSETSYVKAFDYKAN